MAIWRSQHYRKQAHERRWPNDVTEHAVATIEALRRCSQAPVIFTLRHLSIRIGVPYVYLRSLVERDQPDAYHQFRIVKRPLPGEPVRYRIISAPTPRLKKVQQWIDRNILAAAVPDEASVAFTSGSSLYEAASIHCNARWLIKIDIVSFFESITERQVYEVFRTLGYQPLVAFELARLCTRVRETAPISSRWRRFPQHTTTIPAYWHGQLGYLPQGAPTSPRLSNLVVAGLDRTLREVAAQAGLIYTRYADDLIFSTTSDTFSRRSAKAVIGKVYRALAAHGFSPNLAKTKIVPPRGRKVVLGLLTDGQRPRLQREIKARIRKHLYFLTHPEIGPAKHAAANGHATVHGLKNHIQGLLAFAHGIDPDYARAQTKIFQSVEWP